MRWMGISNCLHLFIISSSQPGNYVTLAESSLVGPLLNEGMQGGCQSLDVSLGFMWRWSRTTPAFSFPPNWGLLCWRGGKAGPQAASQETTPTSNSITDFTSFFSSQHMESLRMPRARKMADWFWSDYFKPLLLWAKVLNTPQPQTFGTFKLYICHEFKILTLKLRSHGLTFLLHLFCAVCPPRKGRQNIELPNLGRAEREEAAGGWGEVGESIKKPVSFEKQLKF